mmetsp:Transcript_22135/g.57755  ORF Transcript_22135/g.57755 Transcript_22135/m.57755 type:complete len:181 (-) Transcript_22135:132-674(-)
MPTPGWVRITLPCSYLARCACDDSCLHYSVHIYLQWDLPRTPPWPALNVCTNLQCRCAVIAQPCRSWCAAGPPKDSTTACASCLHHPSMPMHQPNAEANAQAQVHHPPMPQCWHTPFTALHCNNKCITRSSMPKCWRHPSMPKCRKSSAASVFDVQRPPRDSAFACKGSSKLSSPDSSTP